MRKIFGKVLQSKRLRGTKKQKMIIFYSSKQSETLKFFGKVPQSKSLRGIKKNRTKKNTTMMIFYSE